MRLQILVLIPLVGFILAAPYRKSPYLEERDVSPSEVAGTSQLIRNGRFANDTDGWTSRPQGTIWDSYLCIDVPASTPTGNASYLTTTYDFLETTNDVYTVEFTAYSSFEYEIQVKTSQPPLAPNLNIAAALTTTPQPFSKTFLANQASNSTLLFQLGGNEEDATVCISNISMRRIDRSSCVQDAGPAVKVNQYGYLSNGPKVASLVVGNDGEGVSWSLNDRDGTAVASGQAMHPNLDAASNLTVAIIDFSSFDGIGEGFTLAVGNGTSYPFRISSTLYESLRNETLHWLHLLRSGVATDADLTDSEGKGQQEDHAPVPPNEGGYEVPCQDASDSKIVYVEPWTCEYTLNVSQGWYVASDQGRHTVNNGILTAQLLMEYERTLRFSRNRKNAGTGSAVILKRNNSIPDVLDEARWGLDFLMQMQVPANSAPQLFNGSMLDMSGMAHHKVHDNPWKPLPTLPSEALKRRQLHRPSTTATLFLAASAAMCARIFPRFDEAYAQTCLNAARTAYTAAKRHSNVLPPAIDCGSCSSDKEVSAELYWAAAELYLTTNEQQYLEDLTGNPYHAAFSNLSSFSPASVATLGRLDLATIPSQIPNHEVIVRSVVAAADELLKAQTNRFNGFGVLLRDYSNGSVSEASNNVQVFTSTIPAAIEHRIADSPVRRS